MNLRDPYIETNAKKETELPFRKGSVIKFTGISDHTIKEIDKLNNKITYTNDSVDNIKELDTYIKRNKIEVMY